MKDMFFQQNLLDKDYFLTKWSGWPVPTFRNAPSLDLCINKVENVLDFFAAITNPYVALLGHCIDKITGFPTFAVTLTSEIPTRLNHYREYFRVPALVSPHYFNSTERKVALLLIQRHWTITNVISFTVIRTNSWEEIQLLFNNNS